MNINFINAIASLKEGETIDMEKLRATKVYAKLMMAKGQSFGNITDRSQFLLSEKGSHMRAEAFIINRLGQPVEVNKLFVNVDIDSKIKINEATKSYYVELEHPTIDISKDKEADF
jgi:hypothetical protein